MKGYYCFGSTLKRLFENSLEIQWLGLSIFTAEGAGLIPDWRTKILHAKQTKNKKQLFLFILKAQPCGAHVDSQQLIKSDLKFVCYVKPHIGARQGC